MSGTRRRMIRRPTPLARPRGSTLHWLRLPLLRAHLLYLVLAAIYIAWHHPSALGPVLLIAGTGIIGELAPASWRRYFLAEVLLLIGGIASFLWAWDLDHHPFSGRDFVIDGGQLLAFQGWIRMVFVAWLLVPSRPGYLRWFAGLAGVELALLSRDSGLELWPLAILIPAAVIALAWDAHLRVATLRPEDVQVSRSARPAMLRWNGSLIALVCMVAMVVGAVVVRHHQPARNHPSLPTLPRIDARTYQFGGINQHMHLGDRNFQDQNPMVAAKLSAEEPLHPATYYLRALTLPYLDLQRHHGHVSWRAAHHARHPLPSRPSLHQAHPVRLATLYRRADHQDVVLVPDGTSHVGLDDMIADPDGNLYRPGLGEITTRYPVDLGGPLYPEHAWNRYDDGRYLAVPSSLAAGLRRRLGAIELWRELEAPDAARAISGFLQQRCSYSLSSLPAAGAEEGGSLLTFLFDHDPAQRAGHCQFFATAGVILMRAAGHPARCVVGYASNEVVDGEVTFRGLNAHAWAEFQVSSGGTTYWQRFDPTPSSHLEQRRPDGGLGETGDDPFAEDVAEANDREAQRARWWQGIVYWGGGALGLALAGWLVWWLNRREAASPRQRQLARQTEQLIALAVELGLPVDAHTTLTSLATALQERSGVDLETHCRAHLAARFGSGPLPPPWPVDAIRAAARQPVAGA